MAEAGQAGKVTIATNMAGRGTDIKLGAGCEGSRAVWPSSVRSATKAAGWTASCAAGPAGRAIPVRPSSTCRWKTTLMRLFQSERIAGLMDRWAIKKAT